MKVIVNGGTMSQAEIDEYVRRIRKKHPDRIINELTLTINEVASSPLSYSSIRNMNIVGGYDR